MCQNGYSESYTIGQSEITIYFRLSRELQKGDSRKFPKTKRLRHEVEVDEIVDSATSRTIPPDSKIAQKAIDLVRRDYEQPIAPYI